MTMVSCTNEAKVNKDTPEYKLGYSYGAQMGTSLKGDTTLTADEKDADKFVAGVQEALKGDSTTIVTAQQEMQMRVQSQKKSTTPEEGQKIAYNIGLLSGIGGIAQKIEISASLFDFAGVKNGYVDAMTKDSLEMTRPEMDSIFQQIMKPKIDEYRAIMQAEAEAKQAAMAANAGPTVQAGEAFLAANKEKEGIITTESGLQYEIIKEGTGAKPTLADQVKTHYHGTLIDGTVFDSSVERGQPATFPVGGVIRGWQEGIPLMSVGAKYRFYIPQGLAYGMQAPSPKIPAGSALIFDVELIEINPAQ